jgi:uncharacterized protein
MEERVMHSPSANASPYGVPVRDLVRRPGAQREVSTTFPVPAVLGTDVIGVPEGATAELDASLEVVTDGIWVSGSFRGEALGECSRCLDPIRVAVNVPVQGLFLYPGAELGEDEGGDNVFEFDGETVDLEQAVLDAVVTTFPFTPLCRPDCPGLCDQCGARLADEPGHAHEALDPRWAALESVKGSIELPDEKES